MELGSRSLYNIQDASGKVVRKKFTGEQLELASLLESDAEEYIETPSGSVFVDTKLLVLSRVRDNGIKNAVTLMQKARCGLIKKRVPISVKKYVEGYLVVDGNSTAFLLIAAGAKKLPAVMEGSEDY